MANTYSFSNFNLTTLAQAMGTGSPSVIVSPGTGTNFPTPTGGTQFAIVLNDAASRTLYEVVYCTARTGDTMTVLRAQEGTTARTWSIGDYVWCGTTAGTQANMVQVPAMTNGSISPVFAYTTSNQGFAAAGFDPSGFGQLRMVGGNYGTILRNDGSTQYFLQTASGNPYGTWNGFRPFYWNLASGAVTIDGSGSGAGFGGSVSIPGNETVNAVSFFGTSGQFYAQPNNGGSQLLNFQGGQYIQFTPGVGFNYVTGGTHYFTGSIDTGYTITGGYVTSTGNVNANNAVTTGGGGVSSAGPGSFNGNVTASNGYSRASFGGRNNPGDFNANTYNGDFQLSWNGSSGYMIFPNYGSDFILQFGQFGMGAFAETVGYPITFPHQSFGVLAGEGNGQGSWASANPWVVGQYNNPATNGFTLIHLVWVGNGWSGNGGQAVVWWSWGY